MSVCDRNVLNMCLLFAGLGRAAPDPRATVSLNGVDVPLGKGINTNIEDSSLLYNEYPFVFCIIHFPSSCCLSLVVGQCTSKIYLDNYTLSIFHSFPWLYLSSRYIVYDIAQVNLKYLLKIQFKYQSSLWWDRRWDLSRWIGFRTPLKPTATALAPWPRPWVDKRLNQYSSASTAHFLLLCLLVWSKLSGYI